MIWETMMTFSGSRTMRASAIGIFLRNLPKKLHEMHFFFFIRWPEAILFKLHKRNILNHFTIKLKRNTPKLNNILDNKSFEICSEGTKNGYIPIYVVSTRQLPYKLPLLYYSDLAHVWRKQTRHYRRHIFTAITAPRKSTSFFFSVGRNPTEKYWWWALGNAHYFE